MNDVTAVMVLNASMESEDEHLEVMEEAAPNNGIESDVGIIMPSTLSLVMWFVSKGT
jgi:hypothetical protein